jgi:hypothetical protein
MLTTLTTEEGAETLNIMSTNEAARFLHMKPGTLRAWRHEGQGPKSFAFGGRVFYKREDLKAWADEQYRHAVGDTPIAS